MKKALPIAVFSLLVLASGLLQGYWTDRWTGVSATEEEIHRVEKVALEFGAWHGVADARPADPGELKRAGIKAGFFARYTNKLTGSAFDVLLVAGCPGPISVHTPDVCYVGAGYEIAGLEETHELTLKNQMLFPCKSLLFNKPNLASSSNLEVYWSWYANNQWSAPQRPRLSFARSPVLYKMYVIRAVSSGEKRGKDDSLIDFLQQFLPQVDAALCPKTVS